MSFSPQSSHSASSTANGSHRSNGSGGGGGHNTYDSGSGRHNDWSSSQSSVGSSSSGSLSRPTLSSMMSSSAAAAAAGLKTSADIIHSNEFKAIAEHYERGLSECISSVESELSLNKSLSNWPLQSPGSPSPSLPPPAATAPGSPVNEYILSVTHKDSLRHQLSHVRHIRDEYETHLRLREALVKMMKISKSRDCDTEWKENSRVLVAFEKQLELMIGVFHLKVEEIEGWARICPRDQYEIEFRYGGQRHAVRVRIGKDGHREWQHQEFAIKASLIDSIIIRVREVKSGWTKRYVTLGVSHMDAKDMMRSRTQLMTIMANSSGTLKLKVRVKWTPTISSYFTTNNNNNNNNNNTITTTNGYHNNDNNNVNNSSNCDLNSNMIIDDHRLLAITTTSPTIDANTTTDLHHLLSSASSDRSVSRMSSSTTATNNTNHSVISSSSSRDHTIESLAQLMSVIEDFQGQYEELLPMASAVQRLYRLYTRDDHQKSMSSRNGGDYESDDNGSDTEDIDAALAEFGFLEDNDTITTTTTTADDQFNSVISRNSSPTPISSQWEACVINHTRDAIIQLSHCGKWVLKAREKDALRRLRDDAYALQELAKSYGQNSVDEFCGSDPRARDMWHCLTTSTSSAAPLASGIKRDVIIMDWKACSDGLNILMHSYESSDEIIADSSQWLTAKISECDCVTVLHVRAFWSRFERHVSIADVLKVSLDVSRVIRAREVSPFETLLSRFIARDWSPHEVTWTAIRVMITAPADSTMTRIARQWLKIMKDDNESEILSHLLSGLESNSITTRRASCHALAYLRAQSSIDSLLYVSTEDPDPRVREEARKSLSTFGGDAQQRWQQCSLTHMGFTGLSLSSENSKSWANLSVSNLNGKTTF
ncbi:uncharacterized protein LOC128956801 isoform X2 [Oppia nitens]|uniref:uncharacterized protein LOC128956801 isoform X2 n=1 Tax=Oppia nitens TaxID=1686743 RepID=UPI0023DB2F05|nr:uncharacterized protein LOC128956801 isoform X2 [Oppia nitens]